MRTFVPPTSFVSSPETEKIRLLYASDTVASGFYPRHGFIIAPNTIPKYKDYCIVIPRQIHRIAPKFWKDAAAGGRFMPKRISKYMYKEISQIDLPSVDPKVVKKFGDNWKNIESNVWQAIFNFFPNEHKWISSLEVRLTKIGSMGSHYLLKKKQGQHLILNLREDSDYKEIINLLILALIYPLEKDLGLSFTHRQTVRNFIFTRAEFKKLYPNFIPKTFDNPKIPIALKRRSEEYIRYLGVPNIIDPIVEVNKNLSIFGDKESKLLLELIKRRDEIVTYDQIADLVWGQGEFKSYWAINKLTQRIQKKINSLGVNLKISGVRGCGYKISF